MKDSIYIYDRDPEMSGVTIKSISPFGNVYFTINRDSKGYPFETLIIAGKAGDDLQADAEGLARLVSLLLRITEPEKRNKLLLLIIDQLEDIGGEGQAGLGPNRVRSLPDVFAHALKDYLNNPPSTDVENLTTES